MIDGFKCDVSYLDENFLLQEYHSRATVDLKTGETFYPIKVEISPAVFIDIRKKSKQMRGSFHKHYEYLTKKKSKNDTQFCYDNMITSIKDLENKTRLNTTTTRIQRLEAGFNISTTFNPSEMMKNCIIVQSGKEPEVSTERDYKGIFKQYKTGEKEIKIYDKGAERNTGGNLMRIELRYTKNRSLPSGICTLQDICNPFTWGKLKDDVIKEVDKFFILDDVSRIDNIKSKCDRDALIKASSSKYWQSLSTSNKDLTRQERSALTSKAKRFKDRASELRGKYNMGTKQDEINQKIRDIFPDLLRPQRVTFSPVDKEGFCHINQDSPLCFEMEQLPEAIKPKKTRKRMKVTKAGIEYKLAFSTSA